MHLLAGAADEIHIPPPRPKRKPSQPYPRKSEPGAGSSAATDPAPLAGAPSGLGSMLGSAFAGAQPRLTELPCLTLGAHGGPGGAAVAAVAAAASAAAAAAAAAVVAAAGEHVQAQLQARGPQAPAVHAVHALARPRAWHSPRRACGSASMSRQALDSGFVTACFVTSAGSRLEYFCGTNSVVLVV